jgi:predicted nucleic acid-binding protein
VIAYFDTSALAAVYVTEVHSPVARRALRRHGPIPFTSLHRLELRNALELLVGRRLLTGAERDALAAHIQDDRQAGRLVDVSIEWDGVFGRATEWSANHTHRYLTRSLDLLHVASAVEVGCRRFVSGDRRQLTLARRLKLRTTDITRRSTRTPRH